MATDSQIFGNTIRFNMAALMWLPIYESVWGALQVRPNQLSVRERSRRTLTLEPSKSALLTVLLNAVCGQ